MSDQPTPRLEVLGVSKRFPGVRALSDVDLHLGAGEVLALIGENGAGKSTLMKILAGVQEPDAGEIRIDGRTVTMDSCRRAMELGVVLIHQELNLADNLDVGSNIFLGREPIRWGLIDRRAIHREASRYLQMVGLDVAPETLVGDLSIGRQQMIEIAKALSVNAQILIMDEPTSSLSSTETKALFDVVRELRARGVSIIYISHRLGEVHELADRVVVLRDGENAGELSGSEINHDNMVKHMVGRDVSQFYARTPHEIGDVLLDVRELVTPTWPQHRVSFQVRRGEIVGVAGLVGAGRTELLQVLFGVEPALSGTILLEGAPLAKHGTAAVLARGLALVPEDRKQHGLVLEMTVRDNIGLAGLWRHRRPAHWVDESRLDLDADEMIDQMKIRTPTPKQVVQFLSGGNQQKVVMAKWLALAPKMLLLDEPTRGIDVGAKEEIYRLMEQLARQGMGILFVSSEMEEVLGMSDRALVMHEGRITGALSRDELSEESVMQLATGNPSAA